LRWKISLGMRDKKSVVPDTKRSRSHVSSICSSRIGIQLELALTVYLHSLQYPLLARSFTQTAPESRATCRDGLEQRAPSGLRTS
jgi:hypothetical protein